MSDLAKYINELAGDYVENWVGEQLAEEWQKDIDEIQKLKADIAFLTLAAKRADNIEKHRDELAAELKVWKPNFASEGHGCPSCGREYSLGLKEEKVIAGLITDHRKAELQWWDEKGELEDVCKESDERVTFLQDAYHRLYELANSWCTEGQTDRIQLLDQMHEDTL